MWLDPWLFPPFPTHMHTHSNTHRNQWNFYGCNQYLDNWKVNWEWVLFSRSEPGDWHLTNKEAYLTTYFIVFIDHQRPMLHWRYLYLMNHQVECSLLSSSGSRPCPGQLLKTSRSTETQRHSLVSGLDLEIDSIITSYDPPTIKLVWTE